MIENILNGAFGLDEISRITKRFSGLTPFYEINFYNDKRKLYPCEYHAFLTEYGIAKSVSELKKGDKIWIDISAFKSDGTLK